MASSIDFNKAMMTKNLIHTYMEVQYSSLYRLQRRNL